MTSDHHDEHERSPVEDIYDELAGEFERVARADSRSRARSLLRRRLVLVPAAALVLGAGTAGAIAATSGGDEHMAVTLPFSSPALKGSAFGTTVPVRCEAEAQWYEDLLEREGGSLPLEEGELEGGEPFLAISPELGRELRQDLSHLCKEDE